MTAQLLPHNIEAEQGLLGCLLIDPRKYDAICDFFHADMFFYPVHGEIYRAIERVIEGGGTPSGIVIGNQFDAHPDLEKDGGKMYFAGLQSSIVSTVNTRDYAKTLQSLYIRRRIVNLADVVKHKARDASIDESIELDALAYAEKELTAIVDNRPTSSIEAGDAAQKALLWMQDIATGKIVPTKTGMPALDEKIKGLYKGCIYVLAARPGMGKTAMGLSMADNIAHHAPVLFISLEMEADELTQRLMARRTGISVDRQREAVHLTKADWGALVQAQADIARLPLSISYKGGMNIFAIKTEARRYKRKHGVFTLFIDYLGLIASTDKKANKVHQIEEITTNLKELAKELEIPIVLLSQLNRAVEKQENKRPALCDLRDSGSIEQDADVVMFIYRDAYYIERDKPVRKEKESEETFNNRMSEWEYKLLYEQDKAEIIIEKNRQGQRGTAHLSFDGGRQVFE